MREMSLSKFVILQVTDKNNNKNIQYFRMKRTIIISLVASLIALYGGISKAQDYHTAVGLRGGIFSGITVKHFIGDKKVVEGILASRWQGLAVIGLLEFQKPTTTEHLFWYWGVGGHVGLYNKDRYHNFQSPYSSGSFVNVGVDGVLGLEYQFKDFPLDLSIDIKPFLDFIDTEPRILDTGVSARYYF